jgi:flagellar biosynthetic protein FliS
MNPYRAYQQQAYAAWTRIDMLLALYDGAIEKLREAQAALKRRDLAAARPLLTKARLILAGLISAVDASQGDMAQQFLRLYEFVNHSLQQGRLKDVEGSLKVLETLREGLQEIRPQAVEMERSGRLPSADALPRVELTV